MKMDITRLPLAPIARPASTSMIKASKPSGAEDATGRVEPVAAGQASSETSDRVVQGEVLRRSRGSYQSTRAFIDERNLDRARPAGQPSATMQQARSAMLQYANNVRPEPRAELTRGTSVNYFV